MSGKKRENQEEGSAARKAVRRSYECPVCLDHLLPPIHQCHNGHAFCSSCELKIEKCPVCREKLPKRKKIRCLYLEEFVKDLVYECKNEMKGCHVKLKFDELEDHELDCRFSKLSFCENLKLNCALCFSKDEVLDHLSVHGVTGVSEWVEGKQWVELHQKYKKGKLAHVKWSPHFLKFQDHLFFVETKYSGAGKGAISWKVMVAGSAKTAKDYIVRMELKATFNSLFELIWTGPVTDFLGKLQPDFAEFTVPLKTLGLYSTGSNSHWSWIIKLKLSSSHHDQLRLSTDLIVLRTEDSYREILLGTSPPAQRGRPTVSLTPRRQNQNLANRTIVQRYRGNRNSIVDNESESDSESSSESSSE